MASIVIAGDTSGSVTISAPAIAGTPTLTLPTTSGTLVVTGGAQTIEFAAGSAASPSITFTGDTNTGIYSPAADTIAFTEGGAESMRIDSSGNVSIGATSGNGRLNVIVPSAASSGQTPFFVSDATQASFSIQLGTELVRFTTGTSDALTFETNSAERMRITSGGLVGIGTTSPAATLDVGSSINRSGAASNNIYADYRITAATTGVVGSFASRIVGIGGSTYTIPDAAVYKVEALVAQTGVTITNAYGLYINNMTDPSSGGSVTNPWGIYQTASSNKNYFAGDVLVGTTSWSSGSNGISLGNNSNSRILITNSTDFGLELYGGTTNRIGFSASNSSSRVGSITVNTTNTAYNTSSDYRLKENIAPMTGALEKVALLKPCTYTWKVDGSQGEGFIAHELAEVVPQAVTGEKDGVDKDGNPDYQAIDVSFLVATLTAAIQELNAKVEAQAAEIAALKGVN